MKNTKSIYENQIVAIFIDCYIQILSQVYLLNKNNSETKENNYMLKIENFILSELLDRLTPIELRLKYVGILYSLFKKKIKSYKNIKKNHFSLENLRHDSSQLKIITYNSIKTLELKTSTFIGTHKGDLIINKMITNNFDELINIVNTEIEGINGISFKNLSYKKITKLIYYLLFFGFVNPEELDIRLLLQHSQILCAICFFEIKFHKNISKILFILSELSFHYSSINQNMKVRETKNIQELFKFLGKRLTIVQMEELLIQQIENNIFIDDFILINEVYSLT